MKDLNLNERIEKAFKAASKAGEELRKALLKLPKSSWENKGSKYHS